MGQKVSPIGMRVGVIRDWESRWYADKADYGDLLNEDTKIREFLERNSRMLTSPESKLNVQARRMLRLSSVALDLVQLQARLTKTAKTTLLS